MSQLNLKQKFGLGFVATLALCCAGSTIGYAISDPKPDDTAAPTASASARVERLVDEVTPGPTASDVAVAPTTTPPRKPAPNPTRGAAPTSRAPTPAKTTKPPTRKPSPKPTEPAVQQGVHAGAFCKRQGARGVTVTGKPMVCTTTAADERKRWRAA